jgi:hypothetical protein
MEFVKDVRAVFGVAHSAVHWHDNPHVVAAIGKCARQCGGNVAKTTGFCEGIYLGSDEKDVHRSDV